MVDPLIFGKEMEIKVCEVLYLSCEGSSLTIMVDNLIFG